MPNLQNVIIYHGLDLPISIIWESPVILGESGVLFIYFFFIIFQFFDKVPPSKQNSLRLDTAFCGISSGAILFCLCPIKRTSGLYDVLHVIAVSHAINV